MVSSKLVTCVLSVAASAPTSCVAAALPFELLLASAEAERSPICARLGLGLGLGIALGVALRVRARVRVNKNSDEELRLKDLTGIPSLAVVWLKLGCTVAMLWPYHAIQCM